MQFRRKKLLIKNTEIAMKFQGNIPNNDKGFLHLGMKDIYVIFYTLNINLKRGQYFHMKCN